MDINLRNSASCNDRQRVAVHVCGVDATPTNMGDKSLTNDSLPPRGQRDGGAPPPPPQRIVNGIEPKRTGKLVLETSNVTFGHQNDLKTGHWLFTRRHGLWGRPCSPWRAPGSDQHHQRGPTASKRSDPRQPPSRGRPPTTDANVSASPTSHLSAGRSGHSLPRLRATWWRASFIDSAV